MTFVERLHWLFRMALLLFILASVAFLSALTAMRLTIQGREVAMPDLVGTSLNQARQVLRGRGLGLKVEDRIYSPAAVDTIVRQSPPSATSVKVGQYAHVVLSLGPRKMTVPQLQQRSLRSAQVEVLRSGMQLGEVSSAYLPGADADTVVQQYPAAGATDIASPRVNLLVALGPAPPAYVMPDLYGLTVAEAESKLAAAGLRVSKIDVSPGEGSAEAPPGTVIGQTPPRGQCVEAATAIELRGAGQP